MVSGDMAISLQVYIYTYIVDLDLWSLIYGAEKVWII